MNNNRHVISQTILVGITLSVIGIIFYLTFQIIRPFSGLLVASAIFAIFLGPLYNKIKSLTSKSGLSAFLTVISLLLFMIIPLGLLISSLFTEVIMVARSVQTNPEWINSFQFTAEAWLRALQVPVQLADFNLGEQIYQLLSFLASNLGSVAIRSFGVIINLFFSLLTIYFLLINRNNISKYIHNLNIFPKRYFQLITSRVTEIVNGTVRGYLLVVVLQLVVGVTGLSLFQIPSSILLGSLYGFSSLLPVVGGVLLWVPVVLWQLVIGNTVVAIFLTIWFWSFSFLIENIITPKIIGDRTKLHQLIIMFSVFGGISYFGLIGMVLGPVVIALSFIALTILKEFTSVDENHPRTTGLNTQEAEKD